MTKPKWKAGAEAGGLAARLIPDATATLALRVLGLVAQVVLFVVIARALTLPDVGIYAVVNAALALARTLGPSGLDYAAYRFCSGHFDDHHPERAASFGRFALLRAALLNGGVILAAGCGALLLYHAGRISHETGLLVALGCCGVMAYSLLGLASSLHRSSGSMVWAQAPDGLALPLLVTVGAAALVHGSAASVGHVLAIQVAAAWLVLAASLLRWRATVGAAPALPEVDERRQIVTMANRVMAGVSVANLAARSQVFLISATLGPAAAGLYEAASRFGSLATTTSFAANAAVAPLMARARARGDLEEQQNLYTIASVVQSLPAFAILAGLAIAGGWLLSTFIGAQFLPSYWPMLFLALAEVVCALGGPASAFLMMSGREHVALRYNIISLLMILTGMPLMGYFAGLSGAAAVSVLCEIMRTTGMSRAVWLSEKIRPGILAPSEFMRCLQWLRHLPERGLHQSLRFGR